MNVESLSSKGQDHKIAHLLSIKRLVTRKRVNELEIWREYSPYMYRTCMCDVFSVTHSLSIEQKQKYGACSGGPMNEIYRTDPSIIFRNEYTGTQSAPIFTHPRIAAAHVSMYSNCSIQKLQWCCIFHGNGILKKLLPDSFFAAEGSALSALQ